MEESRQDDTGSAYGAKRSLLRNFTKQSKAYHDRIPYVNKLPFSAIAVIVLVGCVNAKASQFMDLQQYHALRNTRSHGEQASCFVHFSPYAGRATCQVLAQVVAIFMVLQLLGEGLYRMLMPEA